MGVYYTVPFGHTGHTAEDRQFLKPSSTLFFAHTIPCSWTLFHTYSSCQLIVLEAHLTDHLLWEALLLRQNRGYALRSPLLQGASQTGRLLGGQGICCPPCAGSLMRQGLLSGIFLSLLPAQSLALSSTQDMLTAPNPSPFLPHRVTVSCWIAVWWHRLARTQAE